MQIYAALLGSAPKIAQRSIEIPSLRIRFWMETLVTREKASPFHKPTFREQVERAAAGAILALGDAGSRLRRARETVNRSKPQSDGPKPIVLIGRAALRPSRRANSPEVLQSAKDSQSEAA